MFLAAFLISLPAVSHAEIFYQWKSIYIGAYDPSAWPGLVLAPDSDARFAFSLQVEKENESAARGDFLYLVAEVGPHSPDGQYARVSFDLGLPLKMGANTPVFLKAPPRNHILTIEWSRRDESTVVGRIICPDNVKVDVIHYLPWDAKGGYVLQPDGMVTGMGGTANTGQYSFWIDRAGVDSRSKPDELSMSYYSKKGLTLYFAAAAGPDGQAVRNGLVKFKSARTISGILEEEAGLYEQKRVMIKGLYQGAAESITNNINWAVAYQPGQHRLYTPSGRALIFPRPEGGTDHWTIVNWDSFLNCLELAVESDKLAVESVRAVLETQYPNGNIPSWRGRFGGTPDRSQPPLGSYVVMRLFQRTGDMDFLRYSYPYLKKWHEFWTSRKRGGQVRRDGNGDGLLEWGSDAELVAEKVPDWEMKAPGLLRAAWESGQDDLPNWDDVVFNEKTGTMALDAVDLNSFYALDSMCLAEMALLLDYNLDAEVFKSEYEKTKELVNRLLWNDKEGFYLDRYWDGRFSAHEAASNFLPLVAGIPDMERAGRMLKHLLDPKKFWGENVIPSISHDDPSFKADDQQSWRGAIFPPANYLIYHGLKDYGFDAPAAELARKSADLFLRTWKNFQICPANFDCLTGEAGVQRFQTWGPLLSLVALEEYLDFTPSEGFRFGMLKPEKSGRLFRIQVQGRRYDVEVSDSRTILYEEGKKILQADKGAIFRRFLYGESEVSFRIKTLEPTVISLWMLKSGRYQLLIDGREKDVFNGGSAKADVLAGEHDVLLQLLRDSGKPGRGI